MLLADGADAQALAGLRDAARETNAMVELVGPRVGGVTLSDGSVEPTDQKIDGGPSVLYDAVAILLSEEGAQTLSDMHEARTWAADAWAHGKVIAHSLEAAPFLKAAGLPDAPGEGVFELEKDAAHDVFKACTRLRVWSRAT